MASKIYIDGDKTGVAFTAHDMGLSVESVSMNIR